MVRNVEHLRAEFQRFRFRYAKILGQREIDILQVRASENPSPGITEGKRSRRRKCLTIPPADAWIRITDTWIADAVGTIIAYGRIAVVCREHRRVRLPTSQRGDAGNLPAADELPVLRDR